jgi:hypothetical protein
MNPELISEGERERERERVCVRACVWKNTFTYTTLHCTDSQITHVVDTNISTRHFFYDLFFKIILFMLPQILMDGVSLWYLCHHPVDSH